MTNCRKPDTAKFTHKRLEKEFHTLQAMIHIYCSDHHSGKNDLCGECNNLLQYAEKRLLNCPFSADKPTCGNCTVHCYKSDMRHTVKEIMRYAGPKMVYKHPLMALQHLFDSRIKPKTLSEVNKQRR